MENSSAYTEDNADQPSAKDSSLRVVLVVALCKQLQHPLPCPPPSPNRPVSSIYTKYLSLSWIEQAGGGRSDSKDWTT